MPAARRCAVLPLAALAVLAAWTLRCRLETRQNPHEGSMDCRTCHITRPEPGGPNLFARDIEALCRGCHPDVRLGRTHPVAVAPTFALPADLPLDWKGEMTCTTCHFMHLDTRRPAGGTAGGLLRRATRGRRFCLECHGRAGGLPGRRGHSLAAGKAHEARGFRVTAPGSPLDRASAACLTCHDGSISPDTGNVRIGSGIWRHGPPPGRSVSHPVGVDYRPGRRRAAALRPRAALPAYIRLPGGRVECLTCHDLYSRNDHLLVVSNERSRLCLTCHEK
ncbi:hypothetical protein G3N55_00925 [Dissulfurirhabdus thermomarina]|uniref:Doubled CXXCH motif domain-containing protein n=1 Tax=Dissulfurirhabdus thermomarina TaxID=1765737 RepID=A0A6N9TJI5_DISTH|nr:cytochrome c3 family protein [Dissulfurirhabdus thermomarina]NDY41415.1 hypothetical protein [Dissulfurirhabdus thermomarina]NMX24403.1 hypothetical protein [Dissulfurirhabdus thermomarina]